MDNKFVVTTVITIILAVLGYLAKYLNDIKITKRKDRLDRVNRQLRELYGPLLSLTSSSHSSWNVFRKKYRKNTAGYFDQSNPPNEHEKEIWRTWILTVFQPINEKIYHLIIENGDLIIEDKFPKPLRELCSHYESYKPVIEQWKNGDYTEHTALLNFPIAIDAYVELSYEALKLKQKNLID